MDIVKQFSIQCFVTIILTFCLIEQTNSCFIRNCPPGGKRSMDTLTRVSRQCMSCGPELSGQCVGPDICCGPFGCYMGTLESSICQKENESTHPCEIQGAPCGSRGQGNCVTDGICCDSGACSYNAKCKTNNMKDNQAILNVLNELLQSRDLTDK
ncbi:terepressin/terephysin-like [Mytilus galloprovincialis]|uniref:Arginine vasopressin n=1 Tax=Mytilus galloprovincialis TaxID=29158 RepID=A0A8B6H034_MYTGA|nr:arginine vasopressin [Mytilus galloprovincialis]